MLAKENRFHGPNSLRFVYRNGNAVHSRLFKVKFTTSSKPRSPRFAIVVSKKVHKSAVGRNRIRRRLYEVVRHEIPKMRTGSGVVIIVVSGEALSLPFADMTMITKQLFTEANLYK